MPMQKRVNLALPESMYVSIEHHLARIRARPYQECATMCDAVRDLLEYALDAHDADASPGPRKTLRPPILGDSPRLVYFTDGTSEPRKP